MQRRTIGRNRIDRPRLRPSLRAAENRQVRVLHSLSGTVPIGETVLKDVADRV